MAVAQQTFQQLTTAGLEQLDPEIAELLGRELERQRNQIELIASENFTWPAIMEAIGSTPTNKYAEGYPGKRYYGGCEVVDEIEQLAIDRAKELFGADHANVQPHAGAQTNMAVYLAALQPGDTILSLELSHGGHLTHGLKVNFSGRLYTIAHYGVSRETNVVDYDEVLQKARESKPQLIVCGGSAYPRTVDTAKFREIADDVGALLLCDMAHFAGLVAAGLQPNPVEHCDFVTSTTHKTLAGPRSGFILCREEHAQAIDRAIFPGLQGGPLEHTIAAKATCFKIAAGEAFRDYQTQVRAQRRHARRDADGRRARRAHRRDRHAPAAARPPLDRLDRQGRRRASARGEADREPQHGSVRRAQADDCERRAHRQPRQQRCAAWTPTTSARSVASSSKHSATHPTSTLSAPEPKPSAPNGRSIPASAAGPPTSRSDRGRDEHLRRSSRSSTRSSSTSSRTCGTRTRRPSTSASSSTRSRCS